MVIPNVAEDDFAGTGEVAQAVAAHAKKVGADWLPVCGDIECELAGMDDEDREMFMADLGLEELALPRLIQCTYDLLGLLTFFTAGPIEIKAWTICKGDSGPTAAGKIHTDFEKGFIRAEVFSVDDLVEHHSEAAIRQAEGLFPTPTAGLVVPGRGAQEPSLEELLLDFGEVTGEQLSWSEGTGELLKAGRPGLDRGLEIPAEELYKTVEAILLHQGFVVVDVSREEPRKLGVVHAATDRREALGSGAVQVPPERLPIYAEHPAIKITTTVTLEHLDGKTLGKTLRALITDHQTLKMVPDLAAKQLTLTGYGSRVATLVEILREVNESAGRRTDNR